MAARTRHVRGVRESGRPRHPGQAALGPVVLDTNVLLDAVLRREPWSAQAMRLLALCEVGALRGLFSVHAMATVFYVIARRFGPPQARAAVADLAAMTSAVELGDDDVRYALALPIADFEDALHVAAARRAGATHLVTRDPRGFRGSPVPAVSPAELLALLPDR